MASHANPTATIRATSNLTMRRRAREREGEAAKAEATATAEGEAATVAWYRREKMAMAEMMSVTVLRVAVGGASNE